MTHLAAMPTWAFIMLVMVFLGPAMRFTFGRRRRWEEIEGRVGGLLGRRDVERLDAAIAERDAVIEDLQHRLSEMESRLDFTERLIASKASETTP